jgi:hypothetical protein
MTRTSQSTVAREARAVFDRIKDVLEALHANQFVAIEPISGEFLVGGTLSDAIGAARQQYPDRLAHTSRVGHKAAVHFSDCRRSLRDRTPF